MSEVRVTMAHARAAKIVGVGVLCAPGIRAWCARYGIDMRELATRGIPLTRFQAIDDAYAQRMVQLVLAEQDGTHG